MLLPWKTDGLETLDSGTRSFVDVRDTAKALLLIYEKDEAEGRYICSSHDITTQDLAEKLKAMYPHYNYPKRYINYISSLIPTNKATNNDHPSIGLLNSKVHDFIC